MDKSLDEIIKTRPKNARRSSGRNARAQVLGNAGVSPVARQRAKANVAKAAAAPTPAAQPQAADKIIVSNLPPDVTEPNVRELFQSTVGALREVTLHHDSNGRSKGIASVRFQRKGDGTKAYQQYNNRLIDGNRPMKIEIVVDPAPSLVSRVAPAATNGTTGTTAARGGPRGVGRGGRRRGGGGGGGGGGKRKADRAPKTAADLDAEMEDYTANNATTTTTTAAPAA